MEYNQWVIITLVSAFLTFCAIGAFTGWMFFSSMAWGAVVGAIVFFVVLALLAVYGMCVSGQ